MALTVQLQLNPCAKPFVPTVNKDNQTAAPPSRKAGGKRGAREQAPDSARACKMGEPTPGGRAKPFSRGQKLSRERGQELEDTIICTKNYKNKNIDYLPEKRGTEGELDDTEHDEKGATAVTELAEGNSSALPITCGKWL